MKRVARGVIAHAGHAGGVAKGAAPAAHVAKQRQRRQIELARREDARIDDQIRLLGHLHGGPRQAKDVADSQRERAHGVKAAPPPRELISHRAGLMPL